MTAYSSHSSAFSTPSFGVSAVSLDHQDGGPRAPADTPTSYPDDTSPVLEASSAHINEVKSTPTVEGVSSAPLAGASTVSESPVNTPTVTSHTSSSPESLTGTSPADSSPTLKTPAPPADTDFPATPVAQKELPEPVSAPSSVPVPPVPQTPTNQPKGWPAIEKALSDFDKEEVQAYKEDMDALLTFAGLYSAALTAFVLVSCTQLQEDTAGETLQVLRPLTNQTAAYAAVAGHAYNPIMVTADLDLNQPFQPSQAAIRTNVLWFCSLVIGLSTASFAILVKQWLRAYTAFATASPQGHLRARRFRRSGIETWKVFAIASMLPLLLQLSLALFFIGLCFFTIDIHPSIGYTTLPLVCAWAFLFVTVTLAPCFSARCPYKTPALTGLATKLRVHIYAALVIAVNKYLIPTTRVTLRIVGIFAQVILGLLYPIYCLIPPVRHFVGTIWIPVGHWEDLLATAMLVPPMEEARAVKDTSQDLDILADADQLQADDALLGSTVAIALAQSNPDWVEATRFLVRIIENRVPPAVDQLGVPVTLGANIFDSSSLSSVAAESISYFLRVHIVEKLPDSFEPDNIAVVQWVVCLCISLYHSTSELTLGRALTSYIKKWGENLSRTLEEFKPRYRLSQRLRRLVAEMLLAMACLRILQVDQLGESFADELLQQYWLRRLPLVTEWQRLPNVVFTLLKHAEAQLQREIQVYKDEHPDELGGHDVASRLKLHEDFRKIMERDINERTKRAVPKPSPSITERRRIWDGLERYCDIDYDWEPENVDI